MMLRLLPDAVLHRHRRKRERGTSGAEGSRLYALVRRFRSDPPHPAVSASPVGIGLRAVPIAFTFRLPLQLLAALPSPSAAH
jgi:hypothetical protein